MLSFKQQVEQAIQQGNTETVERDNYVTTYAVLQDGRRIQVDQQEKEFSFDDILGFEDEIDGFIEVQQQDEPEQDEPEQDDNFLDDFAELELDF